MQILLVCIQKSNYNQLMPKTYFKIAIITILLAASDLISKHLATNGLAEGPIYFFDSVGFIYSQNTGIAFSIPIPFVGIILLNLALFALISYAFATEFKLKDWRANLALALILGGGFGNFIERLFRGFVTDFIAFWSYPRFNLADVYITVGVLMVLAFYAKIKRV